MLGSLGFSRLNAGRIFSHFWNAGCTVQVDPFQMILQYMERHFTNQGAKSEHFWKWLRNGILFFVSSWKNHVVSQHVCNILTMKTAEKMLPPKNFASSVDDGSMTFTYSQTPKEIKRHWINWINPNPVGFGWDLRWFVPLSIAMYLNWRKELHISGWWQLKYLFHFHPENWGKMISHFDVRRFFQMGGLVQPYGLSISSRWARL